MFESKLTGFSCSHPPHDNVLILIYRLTMHALSSNANTNIPIATFLLLPARWNGLRKDACVC
eukprot:109143-Pelagomonas_calceolata.AAC.1